jgi:hypothetical protein
MCIYVIKTNWKVYNVTSCILANWEVDIGRIAIPDPLGQENFWDSILIEIRWSRWHMPVIQAKEKSLKYKDQCSGQPGGEKSEPQ